VPVETYRRAALTVVLAEPVLIAVVVERIVGMVVDVNMGRDPHIAYEVANMPEVMVSGIQVGI
jgi:hypothetical protein